MLDAFTARLEARDPAKGHYRSYRLDAGTDLLGNWTVEITFGRIGARGRSIRHAVGSVAEARALVKATLRRRSSAKRRFGTSYRVLELHDPHAWTSVEI
jgi:hypothetical protein